MSSILIIEKKFIRNFRAIFFLKSIILFYLIFLSLNESYKPTVKEIFAVWIIAEIISIIFLLPEFIKAIKKKISSISFSIEHIYNSFLFTITGFGFVYFKTIEMLYATTYFNELELGVYSLFLRITDVAILLVTAVVTFFYPYMNTINLSFRFTFVSSLLCCLIFALFIYYGYDFLLIISNYLFGTQLNFDINIGLLLSFSYWLGFSVISFKLIKNDRKDLVIISSFLWLLFIPIFRFTDYNIFLIIFLLIFSYSLIYILYEKTSKFRFGTFFS